MYCSSLQNVTVMVCFGISQKDILSVFACYFDWHWANIRQSTSLYVFTSLIKAVILYVLFYLVCTFNLLSTISQTPRQLFSFFIFLLFRCILIGDKECEYNKNFQLILHTKLANPHFPPELQAETTLINFTVTPQGLGDQLLGQVVSSERPDLESLKVNLVRCWLKHFFMSSWKFLVYKNNF